MLHKEAIDSAMSHSWCFMDNSVQLNGSFGLWVLLVDAYFALPMPLSVVELVVESNGSYIDILSVPFNYAMPCVKAMSLKLPNIIFIYVYIINAFFFLSIQRSNKFVRKTVYQPVTNHSLKRLMSLSVIRLFRLIDSSILISVAPLTLLLHMQFAVHTYQINCRLWVFPLFFNTAFDYSITRTNKKK